MPPPDPTTDPTAAPGGIQGLLGNFFSAGNPASLYAGNLNDPATQRAIAGRGLLAMAGGFADAAMPSRMPIPFGAALGHAAAAMGTGEDAAMAARLQAAQAQQAQALGQLTQAKVGMMKDMPAAQAAYDAAGSGGFVPLGTPGTAGNVPATPGAMFTPAQISDAAIKNNLDPELVNTVVAIESSHGANTDNKLSPSNTGLFQMAPANSPGGMNDKPENQLQIGITGLAKEKADLEAKLGRPATNAEVYLAHQQGVTGAAALLTNPDRRAGEVTRPINITNNAGSLGKQAATLPASVFTNYWQNEYAHFAAPYTGMSAARPVQVASVDTGRRTDAVPPGALPGLLGPSGRTIAQLADQARVDAGGPPPGVPPPPGPGPGPGPQLPPVAPGAAPPAGPPQPLVTPPPLQAPVPPITRPQVAAAPTAAPGAIPGAPSPEKIAAAKKLQFYYTMLDLPVPADVAANASWDIKGAEAQRDAQIKLANTGFRVAPGGSVSIGGAPPNWGMPGPTTVFNPATGRPEIASVTQLPGLPPVVRGTGIPSAGSAAETSGGTAGGKAPYEFTDVPVIDPATGQLRTQRMTVAQANAYLSGRGAGGPGPGAPGAAAPGTPSAPGVPGLPQLTPEQTKQQEGVGETLGTEYKNVVEGQENSLKAKPYLLSIQQALQTFNTPGAGAADKLTAFKALQGTLQTAGLPVSQNLQNWIANGEIVGKSGTQLGFELAKSLGSRESQMIVQQAVANNPGLGTSLQGNKDLIALLGSIIDRAQDQRAFYDDWYQNPAHNKSFVGAQTAFNRANPWEVTVSQYAPYQADKIDKATYDKLPPGVKVTKGDGSYWIKPPPGPGGQ